MNRILYAPAAEVFDPHAPVAPEPTDPDLPGNSPTGSSMAGWMSGMDDAPGGQVTPEPAPKPKDANGNNDSTRKGSDSGSAALDDGGGTATVTDPKTKTGTTAEPADKGKGKAEPEPSKPEDEEVEKWPRSSADWENFRNKRKAKEDKLRGEISARETRIKELEAKTTEFEQKLTSKPDVDPEITSKLTRLEAENKELTDRLTVLDVTKHPKFEKYFNGKTDAEIARAKRIVGDDRAAQMEKILKLSDPEYRQAQLNDFLGDLGTFEQSRLAVVIDNLEKISEEREEEIRKAGDHKDKLTTEQVSRSETTRKLMEKAFTDTIKSVQDPQKGSRVFQKLAADQEGADEWNKAVDKRIKQAETILQTNNLPPERITQIVLDAVAYPVVAHAFAHARKAWDEQKAKLEAQVKELSAAQPGGNGSGSRTAPVNGGADHGPETKAGDNPFDVSRKFAERMSKWQDG